MVGENYKKECLEIHKRNRAWSSTGMAKAYNDMEVLCEKVAWKLVKVVTKADTTENLDYADLKASRDPLIPRNVLRAVARNGPKWKPANEARSGGQRRTLRVPGVAAPGEAAGESGTQDDAGPQERTFLDDSRSSLRVSSTRADSSFRARVKRVYAGRATSPCAWAYEASVASSGASTGAEEV